MPIVTKEKLEGKRERDIITFSITNDQFLKALSPICKPELFRTPYAKTIWGWCLAYFTEFSKAPQQDIQDIYMVHKSTLDEEEADPLALFLQSISDSYEAPVDNIEYIIKQSVEYLKLRSLEVLRDSISDCISNRDIPRGESAISEYNAVTALDIELVDSIDSHDAILSAFTSEDELLFRFPGALGLVCGDFKRTDFVACAAFSKIGKSTYLQHVADTSLRHGYNTLFITLEMPIKQVLRRFWTSYSCKPKVTKDVSIPYFYQDDLTEETGKYRIEYTEKHLEGFDPSMEELIRWKKQFKQYYKHGSVKIASFPTRSATVQDLKIYVDNLEYYKNWKPDVIVVDYADLLASKQKDPRHALDDIWSTLRGWALEKNILITTATQTGRASANSDSKIETIAEDIRKINHVTAMVAINGSKEERSHGIYRYEQLASREDQVCVEQAVVLACLDIGKFVLDSRLKSDVIFEGIDTAPKNKGK